MKKLLKNTALSIIAASCICSCSKFYPKSDESQDVQANIEGSSEIAEETVPQPVETLVQGTTLAKKSTLCLMGRDGTMHDIITLQQGSLLDCVFIDGEKDVLSPLAQADQEQDEQNDSETRPQTKYYHVVYDNVDFYISTDDYAPQSSPCILVRKAAVYTDENLSSPMGETSLAFGTTVAKEDSSQADTSQKIFFMSGSGVKQGYVKASCISGREDDIEVIKIAQALKSTSRATARNELFKKAARYSPGPEAKSALEAQKTEVVSNNYEEVVKAMQKVTHGVNIGELMTVDQSKDPFQ